MTEISGNHQIVIENRKKTIMTGVKQVVGFDEESVQLVTEMGELTIRGCDLAIMGFDTEKGELNLEGVIIALVYTTDRKKEGVFAKIFK